MVEVTGIRGGKEGQGKQFPSRSTLLSGTISATLGWLAVVTLIVGVHSSTSISPTTTPSMETTLCLERSLLEWMRLTRSRRLRYTQTRQAHFMISPSTQCTWSGLQSLA